MASLIADDAQNEIQTLKDQLSEKQSAYHSLELSLDYHVVKLSELTEILEAKEPDILRKQFMAKCDQSAGLTIQVEELRFHLNNATLKVESLTEDLRESKETAHQLREERKINQKMLVELGDSVSALIGDEGSKAQVPSWISFGSSLDDIKRKIDVIEADRQKHINENDKLRKQVAELQNKNLRIDTIDQEHNRLIQEAKTLQNECELREEKVKALEQEVKSFREESEIKGSKVKVLEQEMKSVREECVFKGSKVKALEHLFHDINNDRNKEENVPSTPQSLTFEIAEVQCTDESAEIILKKVTPLISKLAETDDKSSPSSIRRRGTLQNEIAQLKKKGKIYKKKLDNREGLLRDIIYQYKELQKGHDKATERIADLEANWAPKKGFVHYQIQKQNTRCDDPLKETPTSDCAITSVRKRIADLEANGAPQISFLQFQTQRQIKPTNNTKQKQVEITRSDNPIEETQTFDSGTDGSQTSVTQRSESDSSSPSGVEIRFPDEGMINKDKKVEKDFARLEHEYDVAMVRVCNLEEELESCRKELEKALLAQKENDTASKEITSIQNELVLAKKEVQLAQSKQKKREQDLWKVIDQYQLLEWENSEAEATLKNVRRLADKASRGDLVYDYMKLQKAHEDANMKLNELERQLKQAKAEAARTKADSRTTRMRITGSQNHYNHLQDQYNKALADNATIEKELARALKEVEMRKKKEASWTEKLSHIREERKRADERNKKLRDENKDLKAHCSDLIQLCNESMETLEQ